MAFSKIFKILQEAVPVLSALRIFYNFFEEKVLYFMQYFLGFRILGTEGYQKSKTFSAVGNLHKNYAGNPALHNDFCTN